MFTYLLATVTVNDLENEMSSELRFQGQKWGVLSRGNPFRPLRGLKGYPAFDPPIFDLEIAIHCSIHFLNRLP